MKRKISAKRIAAACNRARKAVSKMSKEERAELLRRGLEIIHGHK